MEPLLTIEEAADILKLSPHTVRRWVEQKKIPSKKLGRLRRIEESALRNFIDGPVEEIATSERPSAPVSVREGFHATH